MSHYSTTPKEHCDFSKRRETAYKAAPEKPGVTTVNDFKVFEYISGVFFFFFWQGG